MGMTNEEREKEIRKLPIPTEEECLAFYKELMKLADVRFVPYYKMAIKALEQQPCEDECITKAEAINTIHKTIYGFFDIADDDSEEPINDKDELLLTINKAISNAVKALPSVKPQRSRGKWIQTKDDCDGVNFYDFSFECSKCGKEQSFKSNYCPNCGAYMRGEDNDNK